MGKLLIVAYLFHKFEIYRTWQIVKLYPLLYFPCCKGFMDKIIAHQNSKSKYGSTVKPPNNKLMKPANGHHFEFLFKLL
jgi:hypothetical protein